MEEAILHHSAENLNVHKYCIDDLQKLRKMETRVKGQLFGKISQFRLDLNKNALRPI